MKGKSCIILLALFGVLGAQTVLAQGLTCDISAPLQDIRDRVYNPETGIAGETPIAKLRIRRKTSDKRCSYFQRALNNRSCRDAVTLINEAAAGEIRPTRRLRRLACKARIAIIGFKGGKRFRTRLNVLGEWTGLPSKED